MSSIFGWSYPPGCSSTPYDESEAIDLTNGQSLKGYGRAGHGLNGKDADLERSGQITLDSAWWLDDGVITIAGTRYATIAQDEDWSEAELDLAAELVCGCNIHGEWVGDEWNLSEQFSLRIDFPWPDDDTDEEAITKATEAAYKAIEKDSERFERELGLLHHALDQIGKEEHP